MSKGICIKDDPVTFNKHWVHVTGSGNLSLAVIPTNSLMTLQQPYNTSTNDNSDNYIYTLQRRHHYNYDCGSTALYEQPAAVQFTAQLTPCWHLYPLYLQFNGLATPDVVRSPHCLCARKRHSGKWKYWEETIAAMESQLYKVAQLWQRRHCVTLALLQFAKFVKIVFLS